VRPCVPRCHLPCPIFPSAVHAVRLAVLAMPSTHDHTRVYKNVTPFQPNRGKKIPDKVKTALEQAVSASTAGCCSRCADQVVWKKKYGKFKALAQPRKWCVLCCAAKGRAAAAGVGP
jgi:hypothetical protein